MTDGPETISYATYTTGSGVIAGLVRGLATTTDVQHSSGQSVQSAYSSLFVGKRTLGYVQVTADQTAITTAVDLTSLTLAVTVPVGGARIKITGRVGWQLASSTAISGLLILEDGSQLDGSNFQISTSGARLDQIHSIVKTATAGSHTYKLQGVRISGSTQLDMKASATAPAFILVEVIT